MIARTDSESLPSSTCVAPSVLIVEYALELCEEVAVTATTAAATPKAVKMPVI
jgi:hypothetical protein